MSWQWAMVGVAVVYSAITLHFTLKVLEEMSKQVENVRYLLAEMEKRQQRMADDLYGLAHRHKASEWAETTFGLSTDA